MSLLDAALNYAKNGIPVFPVHGINDKGSCTCNHANCVHPGKHPILPGGFKIASIDEQQIIAWWHEYPRANIAVPTGELSGWYVVDIDSKNQGIKHFKDFCDQNSNDVPSANLIAETGGGNAVKLSLTDTAAWV